jgi:hypothetical protein
MGFGNGESRTQFEELKPGDRIAVEQTVTAGANTRRAKTVGRVVRTERCRQAVPCQHAPRQEIFSRLILLELPDGELTTVTVDESTVLHRAE